MKTVIGRRASAILYSWLMCNDIRRKVVMAANICESVPATYLKAGCDVSFLDIDDTFGIPMDELDIFAQKNHDIIIHFNHAYGYIDEKQSASLVKMKEKYPNIIIVEDCCLCIPEMSESSYNADVDVILYSTGNTKVVNIGFGGFAHISTKWDYQTVLIPYSKEDEEAFVNHVKACHTIQNKKADMKMFLGNWMDCDFSMSHDEYFFAVQNQLEKVMEHKQMLNSIYAGIQGSLPRKYANWRYNILLQNSEYCISVLFKNGLYCSNHYMSLCNNYWSDVPTPYCNYIYGHILNLFNDFHYTEEQAIMTRDILKGIAVAIPEEQKWIKS